MKKSVGPLSGVAGGVASVRRRTDRPRFWQKPNANNPDQNVNYVLKFHEYFLLLVLHPAQFITVFRDRFDKLLANILSHSGLNGRIGICYASIGKVSVRQWKEVRTRASLLAQRKNH